jgi:hypothetical protein
VVPAGEGHCRFIVRLYGDSAHAVVFGPPGLTACSWRAGPGWQDRAGDVAAGDQWSTRCAQWPVGWQPSRFLADRAEAERAFALAERLGSINAAAQELGTTWPSLRKAFTRHGLGMPARNPEAVRQRAIAAASRRAGQPATPPLDPVFATLNPGALPARARTEGELYQWVRREEQYATLGANVVVELNSESRARRPTTRAWAIIRRADRVSRPNRPHQPQERRMVADTP